MCDTLFRSRSMSVALRGMSSKFTLLYSPALQYTTKQSNCFIAHYWVLQVSGYLSSCHFKECSDWRECSNCGQWSLLLCQHLLNSSCGAVVLAQQVSGCLSSCHFKDWSAWRECSNCGQWSLLLCRHLLNSCWGAVVLAHDWVLQVSGYLSSCHFKECSAWREWSNCGQWSLVTKLNKVSKCCS